MPAQGWLPIPDLLHEQLPPAGLGHPAAYLLLDAAVGAGGLAAGHLNTARRHLISDRCALAGRNHRGLGFEYLSSGYLPGEHRLWPRGAAPGTQPSCRLWSLRLQQGAKYLHTRVKHLYMPLAVTWAHKAPKLIQPCRPNTWCSAWHAIKQAKDLSSCHLLASPVQEPPFSLGFEIPGHVLADFLSEHH